MKLSGLRFSINVGAVWRFARRLLGLTVVLVGLTMIGCSRYVAVEIPPNCPAGAKWEVRPSALNPEKDHGDCRGSNGRFERAECCGLKPRPICDWIWCSE
jgi:hypothetical protein